jgi:hypothetical protein
VFHPDFGDPVCVMQAVAKQGTSLKKERHGIFGTRVKSGPAPSERPYAHLLAEHPAPYTKRQCARREVIGTPARPGDGTNSSQPQNKEKGLAASAPKPLNFCNVMGAPGRIRTHDSLVRSLVGKLIELISLTFLPTIRPRVHFVRDSARQGKSPSCRIAVLAGMVR